MWRWVGVACLVYGLSSLGLMLGPHRPPTDAPPPSAIDFEGAFPPPVSRPPAQTTVMEQSSGNHVLEWRLPLDGPRVRMLALPMRPPPGASSLVVQLGANLAQELRIGLREDDGSLYLASRRASMVTIEHRLALAELRLSAATADENGRLDPAQVDAVVFVCPDFRGAGGRRMPAVFTLDNLRFE